MRCLVIRKGGHEIHENTRVLSNTGNYTIKNGSVLAYSYIHVQCLG